MSVPHLDDEEKQVLLEEFVSTMPLPQRATVTQGYYDPFNNDNELSTGDVIEVKRVLCRFVDISFHHTVDGSEVKLSVSTRNQTRFRLQVPDPPRHFTDICHVATAWPLSIRAAEKHTGRPPDFKQGNCISLSHHHLRLEEIELSCFRIALQLSRVLWSRVCCILPVVAGFRWCTVLLMLAVITVADGAASPGSVASVSPRVALALPGSNVTIYGIVPPDHTCRWLYKPANASRNIVIYDGFDINNDQPHLYDRFAVRNGCNLDIENIKPSDAGTYTLFDISALPQQRVEMQLQVADSVTVCNGEAATLTFVFPKSSDWLSNVTSIVYGNISRMVTQKHERLATCFERHWALEGVANSTNKFSFTAHVYRDNITYILLIQNASESDNGVYKANEINGGKRTVTIVLVVQADTTSRTSMALQWVLILTVGILLVVGIIIVTVMTALHQTRQLSFKTLKEGMQCLAGCGRHVPASDQGKKLIGDENSTV